MNFPTVKSTEAHHQFLSFFPFFFSFFTNLLSTSTGNCLSTTTPQSTIATISKIYLRKPVGKMTTYLSRLSPIPGFPSYTGPNKVGTLDVELPVSQLESPSPAPSDDIPTVQYRIFYPCEPDAKAKSITWIPSPQRGYVSAYSRFLGAGTYLAEFISCVYPL